MRYTEKMNELMFEQWNKFDIDEEKIVVKMLNDESLFRSFGEGLLALIQKKYPELEIVNLGETNFIITYKVPTKKNKFLEYGKAVFVVLTAFFGGAFSIMTFNTDVSVGDVFDVMYQLVLGQEQSGAGIVEIGYSVGLVVGIMVFYNHFFRKVIHNDPTPIQVEMRKYEEELNSAMIQDTAREGKMIDVS